MEVFTDEILISWYLSFVARKFRLYIIISEMLSRDL